MQFRAYFTKGQPITVEAESGETARKAAAKTAEERCASVTKVKRARGPSTYEQESSR